ncbi:GerAB/ArcD/ProY family transporter [Clostridium aestuarii]|uniref:GerAB/ArcD/ProY family transporter n=1 Tax=Clostridium aestuarii TaxID=338193 RepID=A0ABT4CVW1_9CLOT|nr:GerAB/ArcD/ProY family transporter [Clostridium aestuarii]MCY6483118.1 GerAB/ArcD/ProY family transporter [Clostridium aestuarii]
MNNMDKKFITSNQVTALLLGSTVGPGLLKSPNVLVEQVGQDAWISSIIGLIYPAYILFISNYIIKKHPDDTLLKLSRKFLGTSLGNIFNIIFASQWIIFMTSIASDLIKISRIYFVSFLTPTKVLLIGITISFYAAYEGLETLAKICEVNMYLLIIIMLFSIASLKYGKLLNLQPVLSSDIKDIFSSSILSSYYYIGFEFLLIISPYVKHINEIKKASLKALFIGGLIWVWVVVITIYYLGIDVIPKTYWSFILVFESINVPIINNFRYIFMFIWTFVIFRILANHCFTSYFIINDITNIDIKKILSFLYPIVCILSFQFLNINFYKKVLDIISPIFAIFNTIFISLIAVLSTFNKNHITVNKLNN